VLSARKRPRIGGSQAVDDRAVNNTDYNIPQALPASVERLIVGGDWLKILSVSQATFERLRRAGRIPDPDLFLGKGLARWKPETVRRWIEGGGK
jgi:hypothetical protein